MFTLHAGRHTPFNMFLRQCLLCKMLRQQLEIVPAVNWDTRSKDRQSNRGGHHDISMRGTSEASSNKQRNSPLNISSIVIFSASLPRQHPVRAKRHVERLYFLNVHCCVQVPSHCWLNHSWRNHWWRNLGWPASSDTTISVAHIADASSDSSGKHCWEHIAHASSDFSGKHCWEKHLCKHWAYFADWTIAGATIAETSWQPLVTRVGITRKQRWNH